jgi:hypothetical protein
MTVSLTSVGFRRKAGDDFVEWLKIGFVVPERAMF